MENSVALSVEDEKVGILEKLFSYNGKFGRTEYLIFGLIVPFVFLFVGLFLPSMVIKETGVGMVGIIGIIIAILSLPIYVAATVKRAKDRNESPVLMVIASIIPYIGVIVMLYLLLAPGKKEGEPSKALNIIIGIFIAIILLGILLAIVIPKFVATKHDINSQTQVLPK